MITFGKEWQIPIFPKEELERRWNAIRRLMVPREIDCLIIAGTTAFYKMSGADLRYVSNYAVDWREAYCLLPLQADPILFLGSSYQKYWAEKIPLIPEIVGCPSWLQDFHSPHPTVSKRVEFVTEIVEKIKALGLEKGTLGIDSPAIMPANVYDNLRKELPQAFFVEAEEIVRTCSVIKSPAELEFVRKAGECADKGIQAMIDIARPGITEYELVGACEGAMISAGAEVGSYGLFLSKQWPDGPFDRYGPSARKLQKGDVFLQEMFCCYGGYWVGICHPISIGKPSADFVEMFEISKKMYQMGCDGLRAGNLRREVWEKVREFALSKRPFSRVNAAMLDMDPCCRYPGGSSEFEPGMVVAILPTTQPPESDIRARKGQGHGHHLTGNTCICTEGEAECISKLPLELTVV